MSQTRYIPYGRQCINEEDIQAVIETLRSDYLTTGPKIQEFERKVAGYCGARYAVAVWMSVKPYPSQGRAWRRAARANSSSSTKSRVYIGFSFLNQPDCAFIHFFKII